MKLAVMQPYFLPYLGYWQLLNAVDLFVIYDDVHFIKKGWIHRNRIMTKQGEYLFTVPLSKISQNRLICEHKLADPAGFVSRFVQLINMNYKDAPFFTQGMTLIDDMFSVPTDDLTTLCERSIHIVCKALGISCKIVRSSALNNDKALKSQDKIVDIVKYLHGNTYINLEGGRALYSKEHFAQHDIKLQFIKPQPPLSYPQVFPGFTPYLSIMDMLMCVSTEQLRHWINHYELSA